MPCTRTPIQRADPRVTVVHPVAVRQVVVKPVTARGVPATVTRQRPVVIAVVLVVKRNLTWKNIAAMNDGRSICRVRRSTVHSTLGLMTPAFGMAMHSVRANCTRATPLAPMQRRVRPVAAKSSLRCRLANRAGPGCSVTVVPIVTVATERNGLRKVFRRLDFSTEARRALPITLLPWIGRVERSVLSFQL